MQQATSREADAVYRIAKTFDLKSKL
jgi:hypothetical protein